MEQLPSSTSKSGNDYYLRQQWSQVSGEMGGKCGDGGDQFACLSCYAASWFWENLDHDDDSDYN